MIPDLRLIPGLHPFRVQQLLEAPAQPAQADRVQIRARGDQRLLPLGPQLGAHLRGEVVEGFDDHPHLPQVHRTPGQRDSGGGELLTQGPSGLDQPGGLPGGQAVRPTQPPRRRRRTTRLRQPPRISLSQPGEQHRVGLRDQRDRIRHLSDQLVVGQRPQLHLGRRTDSCPRVQQPGDCGRVQQGCHTANLRAGSDISRPGKRLQRNIFGEPYATSSDPLQPMCCADGQQW